MKKWIATIWLMLLLAIVFGFFWYNQLVYSLPTPVPADYQQVKTGEKIQLTKELDFKDNKPVFLHFFNPDCPCSRFNITQFKSLVKTYHNKVDFAVVLMTNKNYSADEIRKRFGFDLPVISDTTLARSCGVYSTPQAVVLEKGNRLYYRGNYNKSRYCTDQKTSYAKIAIDGVLHHKQELLMDQFALKAYGCSLPNCTL